MSDFTYLPLDRIELVDHDGLLDLLEDDERLDAHPVRVPAAR